MTEIPSGLDDPKMLFIGLPLGEGGKEITMIINDDDY